MTICATLSFGIFAPSSWCKAAPAPSYTAEANQKVYNKRDFSDEKEKEFAKCGLIEAPKALEIRDKPLKTINFIFFIFMKKLKIYRIFISKVFSSPHVLEDRQKKKEKQLQF